jgi:hypothetical protein
VDVTVDKLCGSTLSIQLKHQCDPTVIPPVLAADGRPYYAPRWFYEKVLDLVQAATDIDRISFDYAPCGHVGTCCSKNRPRTACSSCCGACHLTNDSSPVPSSNSHRSASLPLSTTTRTRTASRRKTAPA